MILERARWHTLKSPLGIFFPPPPLLRSSHTQLAPRPGYKAADDARAASLMWRYGGSLLQYRAFSARPERQGSFSFVPAFPGFQLTNHRSGSCTGIPKTQCSSKMRRGDHSYKPRPPPWWRQPPPQQQHSQHHQNQIGQPPKQRVDH